jgi:anti-anti-sigma factor
MATAERPRSLYHRSTATRPNPEPEVRHPVPEDIAWSLASEQVGADTVLRPRGALDLDTSAELRAVGTAAVRAAGPGQVLILDLSQITFVDSTGLGVLVTLWHEANTSGGRFRVVEPSAPAARILAITGVDGLFDIDVAPA